MCIIFGVKFINKSTICGCSYSLANSVSLSILRPYNIVLPTLLLHSPHCCGGLSAHGSTGHPVYSVDCMEYQTH